MLLLPPVAALTALETAGIAFYPAGASIGPRVLTSFEVVMVISGGAMLTLDDRRSSLAPGSAVIARPGMTDRYDWDPSRSSRHYYLHFQVDGAVDTRGWPTVRHWPDVAATTSLFRQLVWLSDRGRLSGHTERLSGTASDGAGAAADAELARGALWLLLATLLTGHTEGADPSRGTSEPLAAALEHIRRRWESAGLIAISRAELAAAAQVSVAHLGRLFTAEYGVGPVAGMEWVRLTRARALIERGSMTVARIAAACGFADQYHFSHRFRAAFGLAPSHLRSAVVGTVGTVPALPPAIARLEHELLSQTPAVPGDGRTA